MKHPFRYRSGEIVPGTGLKIIRPLGSGGMGAVYEVEETSVGAPFVMKVIHPHLLLPGSNAAERMNQEARTQARLNHKNVVRVYRAGVTAETPPLPYYVMDRLSGYSVRQVLQWYRRRGTLVPLSWAFWIGSSVLQALEHAHQHGVVHRDVKPDNIFIHHADQQKPVVKLLDFGIVAAISELSDKSRLTAGGFAGTFTHAAPEQLQGAKPAPTMDIYAVGILMFEMLTGRHPFEDRRDPEQMIRAQISERAPAVARAGVHPKLAALVADMLSKNPKDRPQRAQEALVRLSQIKTEWMQDSSDSSPGGSLDFQFDVDVGERWPTNIDISGDVAIASESEPRPSPRRDRSDGEALRVPALEIPSAGRGRPSTRSTWWTTVEGDRTRIRVDHVLLTAVGFAGVTSVITWLWLQRTTSHPSTDEPAPIATPWSTPPPLPVGVARATEVQPPTPPPPAASVSEPTGSMSGVPAVPIATKAEAPSPPHAAIRRVPALANTSIVRQSPSAEPLPAPQPSGRVNDDPMRP